jgi:hypothetical protein
VIVAHVFLAPYTLPVPFWMYLYGCAAALVLSFALLAYLATTSGSQAPEAMAVGVPDEKGHSVPAERAGSRLWSGVVATLRAGALLALLLTIAAGRWGTPDPNLNIAMNLFWVWFLLAFLYLTAVAGDLYAWTNPWNTLASGLVRLGVDMDRQRVPYPRAAAYWPAAALYVALIFIELFALPRPSLLARALLVYTAIMLAGMYLFGRSTWLRCADLFGVLFRVVGSLAPVAYQRRAGGGSPRVVLRAPLSAALAARADHTSLVVFILFMLSSTTYDTLHETYLWVSLYWQWLLPLLQPLWGSDVIAAQAMLTTGYWWYQWLGLIVSPLLYLAFYMAVMSVTAAMSRSSLAIGTLAKAFAFSLVPIAIAYHATHYVPSMLMQLPSLVPQLADPFSLGWALFPARASTPNPLPMAFVWHAQVFVLLAGHVAAVYLAHMAALEIFPTRRQGVASQLPMLVLMIGYTFLGLWALSLPIGLPQIAPGPG